ncbi:MAG: hypothetical protein ACJ712_11425, partial [Nitrososphaeraceae archaeon]
EVILCHRIVVYFCMLKRVCKLYMNSATNNHQRFLMMSVASNYHVKIAQLQESLVIEYGQTM